MKKYIYNTLALLILGVNVFGQAPNWTVNENNFQYTMSFVAFVNVDGVELSSSNDKVAAFVNGECRGVTNLTFVAIENSYYAYLTVFSNENSEILNFKIYNSVNETVRDVEKTKSFEINRHYGNLFQAFCLANPALYSDAEILDFDIKNVTVNDKSFVGNQIILDLNKGEDVTHLNAVFDLSQGAELYIGTVKQSSGENSIDFINPVQFQVLSEDQSVLKQWEVVVNLSKGTVTYYKKDAVCYTGGAIKVLFTENNEDVVLSREDTVYATQTIVNGETTFSNLGIGIYKVKVGGNVKEIVIDKKE